MKQLKSKKSLLFFLFPLAVFAFVFYFFNLISVKASDNLIKLVPSSVSSYSETENSDFEWKNTSNSLIHDLSEIADFGDFNIDNSAYIDFENVSNVTPSIDGVNLFLEFSSFGVPEDNKEKEIRNAELRFSLAGRSLSSNGKILVEYQKGSEWFLAGEIGLDKDVSNLLNGGYFLYGLPIFENLEDLDNLKIRFIYQNDQYPEIDSQYSVYLDSIWIEVEYFEDISDPDPHSSPGEIKLVSSKKDFSLKEKPVFRLRYEEKESFFERIKASISDAFGNKEVLKAEVLGLEVDVAVENKGNGDFAVSFLDLPREIKPGKYKLLVFSDSFSKEIDFTWGVLALNMNKSFYLPRETAYLQMAALKSDGHTICDTNLEMRVKKEGSGKEDIFSTQDGTIHYSGKCKGNNVTDTPDYFAYYKTGEEGTYNIELENLSNGYKINDSFEVKNSLPFEIERVGPTRIYPPANYQMKIKIKANQDFSGEVVEEIPSSFKIKSVSSDFYLDSGKIIWQANLKAGETYELNYNFNAPNISPYLYLLGPLRVGVFEESRNWQIASDASSKSYYDPTSDVSANWSCSGTGCTTGHYEVLNDGSRDPNAPDTNNYIYAVSNSGVANDEHQINSITESGINYIRLYFYADTGNRAQLDVMLQSNGVTQASSTVTPSSAASWRYIQWDTSSVGTITGEFAISDSGTAKPENANVYAWYIEVDYTENQTPEVNNVSLNGGSSISLIENSTTSVQVTATTSDSDGYTDISSIIGKIYRSGVSGGSSCSVNTNNCYDSISCATSNCGTYSATSCDVSCDFELWFNADPTDGTGGEVDETPWSSEHWVAWVKTIDSVNASSSATNSSQTIEVGSLLGFDVTSPINYGEMGPNDKNDPLDATTTVTNTGNCSLDMILYGVDMESGGNSISVGKQKYASSSVAYDSGISLQVSPGSELELNLIKTTSTSSPETDDVWWGIEIPNLQPYGTYNGTNTFEAKKNEVGSW